MPDIVKLEHGESGTPWTGAPETLVQGKLVALRSAGSFRVLAYALQDQDVKHLENLRALEARPTILLGQPREIWDWLPFVRGPALRLLRRFWPGALTLLARDSYETGLWRALPLAAKDLLGSASGLPLAVADGGLATTWTSSPHGPLIQSEGPASVTTAEEAAALWGDHVGLIVDAALSPHGRATWVETKGKTWRVLEEGAIAAAEIEDATPCRILFICTGNTCRSPLAASLCRKLLADHLGCPQSELHRHGFCVESAGLAAVNGAAATPEAVEVAQAQGAELNNHQSRPLSLELVAFADVLFTMTQSHLELLESLNLDVGPRPQLLSSRGDDVDDPIGGGPDIYQACAAQILAALQERLPELLES